MEEKELPPIQITDDDISKANRLSLHCPICASAVENNVTDRSVRPVVCVKCGTLYHQTCWEQSGGKCAILGCECTENYLYGRNRDPALTITYSDLPSPSVNGVGHQPKLNDSKPNKLVKWNACADPVFGSACGSGF
ncbi:MAG: hypothetical protein M5U34_29720 [Chloroflexi bacterium]|nr:hypothetical protein [Chloroflexota bacterium]